MNHDEDILFTEISGHHGNLGVITLNRPKALNALTQQMCQTLDTKLAQWANADHIKAVIVKANDDRAFCAGGDIRRVYDAGHANELSKADQFFETEYHLNHRIRHYAKPYIAFIDGIVMGGGLGISVHGSHRIATERALFAMPETGIGFFPDVGGSYFLPRCPGYLGTYLGLTGARIKVADAIYAGIATHFISSKHLDECIAALAEAELPGDATHTVNHILKKFTIKPDEPPLAQHRSLIDACFSYDTVEAILEQLRNHVTHEWCQMTADVIASKSPTSLKITLKELRLGKNLDFDACMQMEYTMTQHFLRGHDFYEGVRAVLVDKDQTPHWQPDTLNKVTSEMVDRHFQTEGMGKLYFSSLFISNEKYITV